MKIAIFDHVRKFMSDIIDDWQKQGYTIKIDRYLDPAMVEWADTTFFEFCDISIQRGSDPNDSFYKEKPRSEGKNIIVRAHDIDLHTGNFNGVHWDWVNHLVFVGSHMRDKFLPQINPPDSVKVHMIPHGINTDKFTFREKPKGNKIAWVHNINWPKSLNLALQVLAENPDYELHAVGTSLDRWQKWYVEEFVKRNNLKFFHQDHVEDMNQFLEDKDFILLTSMKEAFSFTIGEGMSKGLKPLIHNYPGAEQVWSQKYIWNKVSEIRPMLEGEHNPKEYQEYIEQNYPLSKMLEAYNKIIIPQ